MKKFIGALFFVCMVVSPCFGYHIEVLQVSNIGPFDDAYNGFVSELARNGINEGENLTITRHVIDAEADASLWKKVGILLKIKSLTSDIVDTKPDLVLTISTPATKYSMNKIIAEGIPLVFSCVANPPLIGCPSVEKSGPGFTGATLYQDPLNFMVLAQMAKPDTKVIGLIHSDDDNAIAFAEETKRKSSQLGITILASQVERSDPIVPAAKELIEAGVDSFAIPLDAYYGFKDQQYGKDLFAIAAEHKMPVFAFVNYDEKGALLYAGPDFTYIGELSGKQAVKILKEGIKPEDLPILKQEDLSIYVDSTIAKNLGIEFSESLLKAAKQR
ncbi:MAG TPA: ABC transporter substrate-binding protein [Deltaproteobacteria bacterium]|nr:ABC transporter substrate-binding protein [Deltaproteobacteria bacterium]